MGCCRGRGDLGQLGSQGLLQSEGGGGSCLRKRHLQPWHGSQKASLSDHPHCTSPSVILQMLTLFTRSIPTPSAVRYMCTSAASRAGPKGRQFKDRAPAGLRGPLFLVVISECR